MKEKILFIVNPISGHHDKSKFPSIVEKLIDKDKYDYTITLTEYGGHAVELTKQAIDNQYDIIVAVGGDGTINEVATTMIGASQTFAIVPYGSGNGLARHLHLPLKPDKVITEVINKGVKSKIDTAAMNGVPYISLAGVGFDAIIADFFAQDPHRGIKTYVKLVTKEYLHFQPKKYHLILDGKEEIDCEPFFISFANSNQFGSNAVVSPTASLNDGLLDVCIFKKPNMLQVPYVATRLLTKKIDRTHFVDIHKAQKIQVIRENDEIANIDGEAVMMPKDITVEINPLSLNILLPNV
ncbi:MAG: YegS/Rv2252/BmrU family lipid kinase [Bacteroidales bacterium]|nr:YegS/Rv2252/BmrU family lipid kinase [Bacteroidales bacterium]MBO7528768.1 YegS/Rv2252/BmrU family lipid kinase [Bacteroidales bacterium]